MFQFNLRMVKENRMDSQCTESILNLLSTFQEACRALYSSVETGYHAQFQQLSSEMEEGLKNILNIIESIDTYGNQLLIKAVKSILDSLQRISGYYLHSDMERCLKKIEFELLPLLAEAYQTYYIFQYLVEHPELLPDYYEKDIHLLGYKPYIQEAIRTGTYKYEVSIVVVAYNKLAYTKRCVESLLSNIPADLNYELILVNHGSSDGTKEYFESVKPHKQLDIAVNGGGIGAMGRIMEGEFTIQISNDVIVMPNTIANLLACIRSDPKIAWAVPSTPNVSNLQAIPGQYSTEEELLAFARNNNRPDPYRWEQRVRLCNPIHILRGDVSCYKDLCLNGYYHTLDPIYCNSFPDDRMSLLLRRNGYKLMLVKNAYCHHFGSVTLKDEIKRHNEQKYYDEGRRIFYEAFGVDPWGPGFCYDPVFQARIVGEEHGHREIVGINCGLGSNSLKIKEQLKEYCHNLDVRLYNITDDPRFIQDLEGVSDKAAVISGIKELKTFFYQGQFHYIVWELPFLTKYKFRSLLNICKKALAPGGKILLKKNDQNCYFLKDGSWETLAGNWIVIIGDEDEHPDRELNRA